MPTVYQRVQEVFPNPIGFEQADAERIVAAFNEHLCITYVLYFQVKKHHWLVRGPQWHDIHLLLDEVAAQLILQADYFAERITYFGGIPISRMSDFEQLSPIKPEPDGLLDLKEMLGNDIIGTVQSLKKLRETHELTDEIKDVYDTSQIEVFIGEREKFCHELHFYIEPDELAADTKDPHREVLLVDSALGQKVSTGGNGNGKTAASVGSTSKGKRK